MCGYFKESVSDTVPLKAKFKVIANIYFIPIKPSLDIS